MKDKNNILLISEDEQFLKVLASKLLFLLVGLGALLLVLIVVAPIIAQNLSQISPQIPVKEGIGNVQMVGYVLFTKFLIPFEIAAIMLLVAMIAGIILAGKGMRYSLTLGESEENQVKDKKKRLYHHYHSKLFEYQAHLLKKVYNK